MLSRAGCYLTTEGGGWATLAFTALVCLVAIWSYDTATFVLSVEAIIIGVAILARQGAKDAIDTERDVAAHAKLDELIHGVPAADDHLAGIEPDPD